MFDNAKMWYVPGARNIIAIQGKDGLSTYSKQTHEEIIAENPGAQLLTYEEIEPMISAAEVAAYVAPVEETTRAKFWEMLEILPPMRWTTVRGVEMFRICEATCGNIRAIYARLGNRYFYCSDRDTVSNEEIAERVAAFARNQ